MSNRPEGFLSERLKQILAPIGWETVEQLPVSYVIRLIRPLAVIKSQDIAETDVDARKSQRKITELGEAIVAVIRRIDELPENLRLNINKAATPLDEILEKIRADDKSADDRCGAVIDSLWQLAAGVEATQSWLEHIAGPTRRGAARVLHTHEAAWAVAQVYVIGTGKLPKAYHDKRTDSLVGLYGETLDAVFDELGLGRSAIGPATRAIERLEGSDNEHFQILCALNDPEKRKSLSLNSKMVF